MFYKVLIACRGEIAVRAIRTLREMGIKSAAAYSQADISSLAARYADQAVCIGPANTAKSYLNINAIIGAAKITGSDAIYPGYGFLSENADFAEACEESGIRFIGPSSATIRMLGDKAEARRIAMSAGIPVTPGSDGCVPPELSTDEALKIGFPLMIKAAAGGGGKGIRIAWNKEDILHEYQMASSEAMASFGNADLYFEKLIQNPRHIEVQFIRDSFGNTIVCPERDCSIQRRHQKLIEESPSPAVSAKDREALSSYALRLAEAAAYCGAGTAEFLLDNEGNFYFMEVNARLQVEHPVTEAITGYDLVRQQILAAAGECLDGFSKGSKGIITAVPHGHAIEMRINAEDPENGFRPAAGTVQSLSLPGGAGIRTDTHLYTGYSLPVYYDSLIAKIIAHAADRKQSINRALRALDELETKGITTTADFCRKILLSREFMEGNADTGLVERLLERKA